jgi:hypothetical protein
MHSTHPQCSHPLLYRLVVALCKVQFLWKGITRFSDHSLLPHLTRFFPFFQLLQFKVNHLLCQDLGCTLTNPMSRAQTPNPYRPASECSPSRRMTPEQIDAAVERLSRAKTPSTTLPPLIPPHIVSSGELEHSVQRLYNQSVTDLQNKQHALEKKFLVDKRPHKQMSLEDTADSVNRLYTASVKSKTDKIAALRKKFLINYEKPHDEKAAEKCAHSVQHLFIEEKQRSEERKKELLNKYVVPTGPKVAKRSQSEIAAAVARLTTPK